MRAVALVCSLLFATHTAAGEAKAASADATNAKAQPAAPGKPQVAAAKADAANTKAVQGAVLKGSTLSGYQYYKFTTKSTRDASADSVSLIEIYFKSKGVKIDMTGVTASAPLGYSPVGEDAMKAVDGLTTTKWLDFQKQYMVIAFPSAVSPDSFTYVTADDSPERDPSAFTMEASTDQTTWVMVTDVSSGFTPSQARIAEQVDFNMNAANPSAWGGGGGSDDGCAGGCIFLIVFFVGGFTYLSAGFAFNHFKRELRGVEAVPQVEFWKDFPHLVKDGVMFSVAKVTGKGGYTQV